MWPRRFNACQHYIASLGMVFLLTLWVAIAGGGGCRNSDSDAQSTVTSAIQLAEEGEPAVELVIDYGDGVERRFTRIPHKEGMTAIDALAFADRHPRGIQIQKSGSGAAALVTTIDDLNNQSGERWQKLALSRQWQASR